MLQENKNVKIIIVNDEVILGQVRDTNSSYIANHFSSMGIYPIGIIAVGSSEKNIVEAVTQSLKEADVTVVCGGMGPAQNDHTRKAVAAVLQSKLVYDEECGEHIKAYVKKHGSGAKSADIAQAYFPEEADILFNENGTAHGFIARTSHGKYVIALPGKPKELCPLCDSIELGAKRIGKIMKTHVINMMRVAEARIVHAAGEIEFPDGVSAEFTNDMGSVGLRITAFAEKEKDAEKLCEKGIELVRESRLSKYIYGVDETPAQVLVRLLAKSEKTVSTAESCTGGLISKMITDCPGSSEVFPGGLVAYANRIKNMYLFVSTHTLSEYGAVSRQTAAKMAEGVCKMFTTDYGIGVTGLAGPGGATADKPVGLVYISICTKGKSTVYKKNFTGDREMVRTQAANYALRKLLSEILKDSDDED